MVIAFALLPTPPEMLAMPTSVVPAFGALLADATTMPATAMPSSAPGETEIADAPTDAPLEPAAITLLAAFLPRIAPVASAGDRPVAAPGDAVTKDDPTEMQSCGGPAPIATLLAALLPNPALPAFAQTPAPATSSPTRPTAPSEIATAAFYTRQAAPTPEARMLQPAAPFLPVQTTAPAPLDAVPVPRLDLSRDTVWIGTLARDIVAIGSADGKLRFALHPEALGRIGVDIRHSEEGVHVHVATRSEPARAIVAEAQPRLTDELRSQGVRVAETQVSTDADRQAARQHGIPHVMIEAAIAPLPLREPAVARDGRFA